MISAGWSVKLRNACGILDGRYAKPPSSSWKSSSPILTLNRLQNMDRLFLLVVHMQRRAAVRRDLDDEVVKRACCVFAGDLEDEIASRARLEAKALVWRQDRVWGGGRWHLQLLW